MKLSKCPTCDPNTETEFDNALGHLVCCGCGQVLEQNAMVSELTFTESSKGAAIADGFTLKVGQARAKSKQYSGLPGLRMNQDSSEATRERGHLSIERAGNMQGINMGPNLIEKAKRVFDIALTAKYTNGRRTNCVVAACCYVTCRMEQTSHMMIDFADAFSTNVYQIGAIFLQLRTIFLNESGNPSMPMVDPSLYMARFADKLDFGVDTSKIVQQANRIAQRMNRDWIVTGRRPAGICAASLFIAARLNDYNRTIREIVLVVKICEGTLRRRLQEFSNTESGQLTTSDFQTIDLDTSENPPSFKNPLKRKHEKDFIIPEAMDDAETEDMINNVTNIVEQSNQLELDTLQQHETLSDLDDDPEIINSLAMDEDEQEFKRELWMAENGDWLQRQEQQTSKSNIKQPKKKTKKNQPRIKASSAAEAAQMMIESRPALSKKINYDVLNSLLQDPNME